MKNINKIVKDSYVLFSKYKPGKNINACTYCCLLEEEAQKLLTLPLEKIDIDLLSSYTYAAHSSDFNYFNELRYFTPRYLELTKDYQFVLADPSLSFYRFSDYQFSDWENDEQTLLQNFALELFTHFLSQGHKDVIHTSIEILYMFHKGQFNIDPLLLEWQRFTKEGYLLCFGDFLDDKMSLENGSIAIKTIDDYQEFNKKICSWLDNNLVVQKFTKELATYTPNLTSRLQEIKWKYGKIALG